MYPSPFGSWGVIFPGLCLQKAMAQKETGCLWLLLCSWQVVPATHGHLSGDMLRAAQCGTGAWPWKAEGWLPTGLQLPGEQEINPKLVPADSALKQSQGTFSTS